MKTRHRIQMEILEERDLLAVTAGTLSGIAPEATSASTWYVTTLSDVISESDNLLSLREAVALALGGDTITFSSDLINGTLSITEGHIKISKAITIRGLTNSSGDIATTISGINANRIFYTTADNGALTLQNLIIANGNAGEGQRGSAILNTGTLSIKNCSFTNNNASGRSYGGAIRNEGGSITITDSSFSNNRAYLGAGISNKSGTVTLTNTDFFNNTASFNGGAIYNEGTVTITSCSINRNNAVSGAGIRNLGTITIINSEFTANTASLQGGAVWTSGISTFRNCTIAGNTGAVCGGIYCEGSVSASLNLYNTIVYSNTQSDISSLAGFRDICGAASGSYNLSSKSISGTANIISTAAASSIFTSPAKGDYSLTDNSEAIDAGYNNYAIDAGGKPLSCDLAEHSRIVNSIVDIGAYEYQQKPGFEVSIIGYNGSYDGFSHGVSLSGTLPSDTIYYSTDGSSYTSTSPITYTDTGSYKVYVKVLRSGYTPWTGSADIVITPRQLTVSGTTISDKVYDGTTTAEITLGSVSGLLDKDNVTVTANGSFPSSEIGTYNITVQYTLSGIKTTNYTAPESETIQASIVSELTKKVSVMVVISDTIPTISTTSQLPSSLTTVETGTTVYSQVWVKNIDGSTLGITGGYIDLSYTYPQLLYGSYTHSDLFSEATDLVNSSVNGTLSLYGGCPKIKETNLGVSSWALLGYNSFIVQGDGTITVSAKKPTINGAETSSLNLTRLTIGLLKDSEIDYNSVTVTAETRLPKLATPVITSIASYGGNRHLVTWNPVSSASKYELQWSTNPSGGIWNSLITTSTSDVVAGLTYGTKIYYRLSALGDGISYGNSDWTTIESLRVCPMDVDSDGFIGAGDYSLISGAWLTTVVNLNWDYRCDIDGDGFVGPGDRSFLMANWFKDSNASDLYYPAIRTSLPFLEENIIDIIFMSDEEALLDVWQ